MADEGSWTIQVNPKIGDTLINVRGTDVASVLAQYDELMEELKERGVGQPYVKPVGQGIVTQTVPAPTHEQAVAAVQTNLGGTPVTGNGPPHPPMPDTGPDGALHSFKTCPVCNAPLKISDKLTQKGDRWYRKLECNADYKHTKSQEEHIQKLVWSEDYKKKRSW